MTEAKFTKGPWRVSAGNETEVFSLDALNVARANCGGVTGVRVAEAEANAHLIAASPDMYEALDGLHKTVMNAFPSLARSEPMVLAAQVLAKARGEQ